MVTTLRESKTRLSELVARAEAGEEVLITVRGRPAARLVPVAAAASPDADRARWVRELRARLQTASSTKPVAPANSSRRILEDLRGERS
jgi:prevent-host-death family protein